MSQYDLLEYIKLRGKWVAIQELVEHFGVRQQNIARKVRRLNEQGYLEVIVDGRRRLIKYNKGIKIN